MRKSSGEPVGRPGGGRKVRYPEIAERIQTLMDKRGLARRDLVRSLGCTDATFGNYYNGWRIPEGRYADKIATMLGVTVDYLLYGKGERPPSIIQQGSILTPEEIFVLRRILEKLTI